MWVQRRRGTHFHWACSNSKHYHEKLDKSLLRRFFLKCWCLISPHRIPHGVIISTDVAPVVPTALTCTTSRVWVSPAVGPERPDGNKNGLCSLIASSPHSTTRSKALSCSTTLIYVLHTHVAATQPLSNPAAPCPLVTPRVVFRERWANFQHGDLQDSCYSAEEIPVKYQLIRHTR